MPDSRPLSPHLTIYKPQISSVLSIMHRMTGVFLYFGVLLLALWVVMNVYGCGSCVNPLFAAGIAKIVLAAWSAALYYHLCNGIRHLFWDAGYGYSLPVMRRSGIVVVLAAALATALTWALVLGYM